jgi:hypothetical protein
MTHVLADTVIGAVGAAVLRARAAGLDWPQVEAVIDDALEAQLYGRREVAGSRGRPWPAVARLRLPACRAPQARRHPGAAPPRVP